MYGSSHVSVGLCAGYTNTRGSEISVVYEADCPLPVKPIDLLVLVNHIQYIKKECFF